MRNEEDRAPVIVGRREARDHRDESACHAWTGCRGCRAPRKAGPSRKVLKRRPRDRIPSRSTLRDREVIRAGRESECVRDMPCKRRRHRIDRGSELSVRERERALRSLCGRPGRSELRRPGRLGSTAGGERTRRRCIRSLATEDSTLIPGPGLLLRVIACSQTRM